MASLWSKVLPVIVAVEFVLPFMDRVLYHVTGNQLTLIKRRQGAREGAA